MDEERRAKEEEERERRAMIGRVGASPFGDLFAELKAKRGGNADCEVFGEE